MRNLPNDSTVICDLIERLIFCPPECEGQLKYRSSKNKGVTKQSATHCVIMAAPGNAASQMASAVFKWERLLMGERASMPFYAEFAGQLQLAASEGPKTVNTAAHRAGTEESAAAESCYQEEQGALLC